MALMNLSDNGGRCGLAGASLVELQGVLPQARSRTRRHLRRGVAAATTRILLAEASNDGAIHLFRSSKLQRSYRTAEMQRSRSASELQQE